MRRSTPWMLALFLLLLIGKTPAEISIHTIGDLQSIGVEPTFPLDGDYLLENDIDAGSVSNFHPIGTDSTPFVGTFDGQGHIIRNLSIDFPTSDSIGLFGYIDGGAEIRNLGVLDANVIGQDMVGILVGTNSFSTVDACYTSGFVTGGESVGGVVGAALIVFGEVTNSYSFANVEGDQYIGGVVGQSALGITSNNYSRGSVSGLDYFGGLIGLNNAFIEDSYSTALVDEDGGGLVGQSTDTEYVEFSYWDMDTSGRTLSEGGGEGRDTATMTTVPYPANVYEGWDFADSWTTDTLNLNNGYPFHAWQTRQFTLSYDAQEGGVIDGPTNQNRIPGADGAPVTATALPGFAFAGWSDGEMDATRADTRVGDNLNVTANFDDIQPPVSQLMTPAKNTIVGTVVELDFHASDNSTAPITTTLYVQGPGDATLGAASVQAVGTSGTLVYTVTESGYHHFATRAIDDAGNEEATPASPEVTLIVNMVENGPLTLPLQSGDMATTFPMTNDLDVIIDISDADTPSSITVQRIVGSASPGGILDADKLIDEYLVITGDGIGNGWTADLSWAFDPDNAATITGTLDTVFQFDGTTLLNQYPVSPAGDVITVTGITEFSEWYAGDASSDVEDWHSLDD
ncbi:MAG: hypothetical protein JJU11_13765 [Candidatus Sumerlaeia bacterium]|nr:hypothetical protein [Candidatus Sumerlaeia bacterium]